MRLPQRSRPRRRQATRPLGRPATRPRHMCNLRPHLRRQRSCRALWEGPFTYRPTLAVLSLAPSSASTPVAGGASARVVGKAVHRRGVCPRLPSRPLVAWRPVLRKPSSEQLPRPVACWEEVYREGRAPSYEVSLGLKERPEFLQHRKASIRATVQQLPEHHTTQAADSEQSPPMGSIGPAPEAQAQFDDGADVAKSPRGTCSRHRFHHGRPFLLHSLPRRTPTRSPNPRPIRVLCNAVRRHGRG